MKKTVLLLAAFFALLSCVKPTPDASVPEGTLVFKLSATYPEPSTRAVKTTWVTGDVVFVCIDRIAAPQYVRMYYTGSAWTCTLMNGDSAVDSFDTDLNGQTINLRAVYRPFGNGDYLTEGLSGKFLFNDPQDSYFLTDLRSTTVSANTISVNFSMSLGTDDFVQFYVADSTPNANDKAYLLQTDAVQGYRLNGINADMTLDEENLGVSHGMTGYAYEGGLVFSGKKAGSYTYAPNYYFAKTKLSDASRSDYLVQGKTLNQKASIILPASDSPKWLPQGSTSTVSLDAAGVWYTTDYGSSFPEWPGATYNYTEALSLQDETHVLPSGAQLLALVTLGSIPMSLKGRPGNVFISGSNFMFLPAPVERYYWGAAAEEDGTAYYLYSNPSGSSSVNSGSTENYRGIRYVTAH